MKTNLKTMPNMNDEKYELWDGWTNENMKDKYYRVLVDIDKWKADLEKELRDRDFLKVWVNAHDRSLIQEILGEDKE